MSRSDSPKRRHAEKHESVAWRCSITGKPMYHSRKRALTALNHARAHPHGESRPVAVYRCPHCREWHLTSQQPRETDRPHARAS